MTSAGAISLQGYSTLSAIGHVLDAALRTLDIDQRSSWSSIVEATKDGGCDTFGVERRLVIDVDGPLDPNAVEVRYTETSAGAS